MSIRTLSVVEWGGTSFKVPSDITNKYCDFTLLGRGTYGQVYSACHIQTNVPVAIKILDLLQTSEGVPATTLREIALLKHLSHRNIVQLQSISLGPQSFALVFEKCDIDVGMILDDLGLKGQSMNRRLVQHLMQQLLEAVSYLHRSHVLHRDIKPQNMFLKHNSDGVPVDLKLGDFGLACSNDLSPVHELRNCGVVTLWYRAPELLLGHSNYSWKADIWSTGCLFVEMLSGTPLFTGTSEHAQLRRISTLLSDSPWAEVYEEISLINPLKIMIQAGKNTGHKFSSLLSTLCDPLACDLALKLLDINPNTRISAEAALQHPYFTVNKDPTSLSLTESDDGIRRGAEQFRTMVDQVVQQGLVSILDMFQKHHQVVKQCPRQDDLTKQLASLRTCNLLTRNK